MQVQVGRYPIRSAEQQHRRLEAFLARWQERAFRSRKASQLQSSYSLRLCDRATTKRFHPGCGAECASRIAGMGFFFGRSCPLAELSLNDPVRGEWHGGRINDADHGIAVDARFFAPPSAAHGAA